MEIVGGSIVTGVIIFIFIILLLILAISILELIGKWKLLKKAGKKGWEAIIPYYSTWTLVEISGCKWWFFIIIVCSSALSLNFSYDINETTNISFNSLELIGSIINFVAMLCINYNIAKKCNKDMAYAVGLTILPFIFYPMLGLGNTNFDNNVKVSPYSFIKEGER